MLFTVILGLSSSVVPVQYMQLRFGVVFVIVNSFSFLSCFTVMYDCYVGNCVVHGQSFFGFCGCQFDSNW
jgi:hypothetical protein